MFTLQAAELAHFVKGGDSSSPKLSCSVIVQYVIGLLLATPSLSPSPRCQRKIDKRGTRADRGEEEVEEGKVSAKEYGAEGSDCSVG